MATKAQIFFPALAGLYFDGAALSGGLVNFYEPGGVTPRTVYQNRNKTVEAANPFELDANGQGEVFLDGVYDIVIKNSAGVTKATWEGYAASDNNLSRGCLVYNNAACNSGDPVTWASEAYDTDNIHSTVTDTHRLTVPAGVTKVQVIAQVGLAGGTPDMQIQLTKNGAVYPGMPIINKGENGYEQLISPEIGVQVGDFFQVEPTGGANPVVGANASGNNWFAMKIIE